MSNEESKAVIRMRNDDSIRKWMNSDLVISEIEHATFISKLKNTNCKYFLVKRSENILGVISLTRIDQNNKNAYIGIYKNPFISERNLGTVLMEALHYLAFSVIGLHTLKLEVIEINDRAISLYKKCGYTEEGRLHQFIYRDNNYYDMIIMGILANDKKENSN